MCLILCHLQLTCCLLIYLLLFIQTTRFIHHLLTLLCFCQCPFLPLSLQRAQTLFQGLGLGLNLNLRGLRGLRGWHLLFINMICPLHRWLYENNICPTPGTRTESFHTLRMTGMTTYHECTIILIIAKTVGVERGKGSHDKGWVFVC